jgi:hypothetical protein
MRQRKSKEIARRIDLHYFAKPHPFRGMRRALIIVASIAAVLYVTVLSLPASPTTATPGTPARHGHALLHNPGPLTSAHAQFANDCAACHGETKDGTSAGSKGEWSMHVTDAHCLSCHDGSVHHPNQLRFVTAGAEGKAATSSDCVSCHIEHRGDRIMLGSDSSNCTTCHADLKQDARDPAAVKLANSVTGFSATSHPGFGRALLADASKPRSADNPWIDPTDLKFNHAKHNGMALLADNCTACHNAVDPAPQSSPPSDKVAPPWITTTDRPLAWANSSDTRNITAINFDRHCIACHTADMAVVPSAKTPAANTTLAPIAFSDSPVVAHEDLSLVRFQVATWLDQAVGNPGIKFTESVAARPPRKATVTTIDQQRWLAHNLNFTAAETNKLFAARGAFAGKTLATVAVPAVAAAAPASTQPSTTPTTALATPPADALDPAILVDYYTTFVAAKSCLYCHSLEGELPDVKTGFPKTNALRTAPTKIPDSPRRWFAASQFDHYAHRNVNCIDCHAPAWDSTDTKDLLSPDHTDRFHVALLGTDKGDRMKVFADPTHPDAKAAGVRTSLSCVDCHKDSTLLTAAAPNDCVTCHTYHDLTKERSPDGRQNPHTGKPLWSAIKPLDADGK